MMPDTDSAMISNPPDAEAIGFQRTPLPDAVIDRLVDADAGAGLRTAFIDAIKMFAARELPWSCGRQRVVFHLGRTVAKLPLSMDGVHANATERSQYRQTLAGKAYCPVAACRIRHDSQGIPILLMRTVVPLKSTCNVADWVLAVDCQQVGHDARGRLVAYDL